MTFPTLAVDVDGPDTKAAGAETVASVDTTSDGQMSWTVEEEKAVRRKLDWHVVPLVTFLYLLCFLDRANIGNARIMGMATELKLINYRFNWALTVFYISYLIVEVPSNIALKRVGPRVWIPFLVAGFGLISLCTSFVQTYAQLCGCRFLLGIFEGGTMPGIAFYLSCFYRRKELYFRIGIFVSASSMAGAFGGLLATVLSRIPPWGVSSMKMHGWRNIFFFEGLLTMLVAFVAPFLMPASPGVCSFLNEREQMIARNRIIIEQKSNPKNQVTMRHVKRAMLNPNNIICGFGFFCINITVQGLSLFLPSILNDLGWTATKSQLYSVPPYVSASAVSILIAFVSDKTVKRGIYLALFAVLPIIGFSLLRWKDSDNSVRYMAVFFAAIGAFPGGPGFLAWAINNSAGPTVQAVTSAYIVSLGTLGGIVATWTYVSKDAPKYHTGHSINLGAEFGVMLLALLGIAYCMYENRARIAGKRDYRIATDSGKSDEDKADLGHLHPEFRYIS